MSDTPLQLSGFITTPRAYEQNLETSSETQITFRNNKDISESKPNGEIEDQHRQSVKALHRKLRLDELQHYRDYQDDSMTSDYQDSNANQNFYADQTSQKLDKHDMSLMPSTLHRASTASSTGKRTDQETLTKSPGKAALRPCKLQI